MKIAIGADHGGFFLKEKAIEVLSGIPEIKIIDCGNSILEPEDNFPKYAHLVSSGVDKKKFEKGILCCSTGHGMAIIANKYQGVRSAVCIDKDDVIQARGHLDINVLALGGRNVKEVDLKEIITFFLETPALDGEGKKYKKRREQMAKLI